MVRGMGRNRRFHYTIGTWEPTAGAEHTNNDEFMLDAEAGNPQFHGYQAAICGEPESSNPFPESELGHLAWLRGWRLYFTDGQAERKLR